MMQPSPKFESKVALQFHNQKNLKDDWEAKLFHLGRCHQYHMRDHNDRISPHKLPPQFLIPISRGPLLVKHLVHQFQSGRRCIGLWFGFHFCLIYTPHKNSIRFVPAQGQPLPVKTCNILKEESIQSISYKDEIIQVGKVLGLSIYKLNEHQILLS